MEKSESRNFLMHKIKEGYSIAIPAYGRPKEYEELLQSILDMNRMADEVVICEDFSKERSVITQITNQFRPLFALKNVILTYVENDENLGYDANVRKLIDIALYKWVILIGNDDLFLKNGLEEIHSFCQRNNSVAMISRPFVRFEKDINKPLGISRILSKERIIKKDDSPKLIFRSCGFVGGLVINKVWAKEFATDKYDGTLYYQIYLAAHAFCTNGIGYLSMPSVAGRTGNPPLFGDSDKDGKTHISGAYSAKGRASMWKGVIDISNDIEKFYNVKMVQELRKELMIRQSFHIFEMNVGVTKKILFELKTELEKLNLFNHWFPKLLFFINLNFGKNAYYFYYFVRKILQ